MTARRLLVTGRVQGVGYRDWTVREARRLGIDGWVRNRGDGSVEIVADGAGLQAFIERCRFGPPWSHVDAVAVDDAEEPVASGSGFSRKPTV